MECRKRTTIQQKLTLSTDKGAGQGKNQMCRVLTYRAAARSESMATLEAGISPTAVFTTKILLLMILMMKVT
jgi:hypothetical protein